MKEVKLYPKKGDSKGVYLFKKILEDRKLISETLRNGGDLSDLKDRINFVTPLSLQ